MRSKERDKAGGAFDRFRGRIQEAGAALSGSYRQRAKGRFRQDRGSARKKRGHFRDLLRK
jgi:uncharacterized protein YjbJ (UPF0337 family)